MTATVSPAADAVLERGARRFALYERGYRAYAGGPLRGARLLDFGAGAGGFLLAARAAGIDVTGVEIDQDRQAQFLARNPAEPERFILYDGGMLPLPTASFDAVHSWFVFEHVTEPGLALREIARVLRPGGHVEIFADDARNAWDGHVSLPWPPYMPRRFARAYLSAFGLEHRTEFVRDYVVYVTAPQIADILSTLGFDILTADPVNPDRKVEGLTIATEEEARAAGLRNRAALESGRITPPAQHLHIVARKRG